MGHDTTERSVWMYRLIHLLVEWNESCFEIPKDFSDAIEHITQLDDVLLADLVTEMTEALNDSY